VGKRCKRVNMVWILCTHECKEKKKDTCWNDFLNWGRIKENGGGGKFKYGIFDIL
jgi:hypothetical protein